MARKGDSSRTFNVAVVGLSGTEREKGNTGVGKSCLCNRFVRPDEDEYHVDHISVLSQTDFSGRVVNNDHFLYWGDTTRTSDDGVDFTFQVVEQTEFIDDASFQPFKGSKTDPYVKRCAATKLHSAEKLMYICKNQLGIEKEYEQKVLPEGRMVVDGFLCVFDVGYVQNRILEKQVEFTIAILSNIMRTKKPAVLVTTKNDEANELYVKEAERLINRKEFRGNIIMVESSAHQNVNVELAFITLAQLIDRSKGRIRTLSYLDASKHKKDLLDLATENYKRLIRSQVTDYRALWNSSSKKFSQHPDFLHYCSLMGHESAQKVFKYHIEKLKEEFLTRKVQGYLELFPEIFQEIFPDLSSIENGEWSTILQKIRDHPDFDRYFVDLWRTEADLLETTDTRIPFGLLNSSKAETCFRNHVNALQFEQKRLEYKKEFKRLLEETGYVTPGKSFSEVRVLFMGRECFEAITEQEALDIYEKHQKEITERAKHSFQELLLEHADLFYHFSSVTPTGAITQNDIKDITDNLQDDSRYKSLDRLDQDRKLMLFQHLGFVHYPIKEHCPAYPNCMDSLIERIVSTKSQKSLKAGPLPLGENNQLNLVLLGAETLAEELSNEIRDQCDDDEYELDNQLYTLDYRIINGDVNLPQNSFQTPDFTPHGCFCAYSSESSLEYIRECLEKTLLSNLEQDDRLPFQGLPIVILFVTDPSIDEKEVLNLIEDGKSLAESLQCEYLDVSGDSSSSTHCFDSHLVSFALKSLVESIRSRISSFNIYHTLTDVRDPDIRIIMCMLCGDPYSVENVVGPLLGHPNCKLSGERSITLETFLGDCKRCVEVIISSYHGANAFRDELLHGFILVYSTKRKASLASLNAFSANIPDLPIQILAVTESGGANALFNNEISHILITEGNAIADRLQAHFMTLTSTCQQKTAFYTPFFKEVWEKKPEIEQAFNMEDSHSKDRDDSGEGTLEKSISHLPKPPPRRESYHIRMGSNDGSGGSESHYERLPPDGLIDDSNDPLSPSFVDDTALTGSDDSDLYPGSSAQENGDHLVKPSQLRSRGTLRQGGFQVFPSPATPPEPAPPDLPPRRLMKAVTLPTETRTSPDDITSEENGSPESLPPEGGWNTSLFSHGDNWHHSDSYTRHAFTTGRNRQVPPPIKPKPKGAMTLREPGRINLKQYSHVTDAISRLNFGNKEGSKVGKFGLHAPLATPESIDLPSDYAQVKDAVSSQFEDDYSYMVVQDNKMKPRHRREKEVPAYSDSDSEYSSLERRRNLDLYSKVSRKPTPHKRTRKKRTAIPVATPRVPPLPSFPSHKAGGQNISQRYSSDGVDRAHSGSPSDISEGSDEDAAHSSQQPQFRMRKPITWKKNLHSSNNNNTGSPNTGNTSSSNGAMFTNLQTTFSQPLPSDSEVFLPSSKLKLDSPFSFEDSSYDISSPRDLNSPLMFGMFPKSREYGTSKRKDKTKGKEDEKQVRQRRKEEEKLKKIAEKEKEKQEKGKRKKQKLKSASVQQTLQLEDLVQNDGKSVPLFLEKCVTFIEKEGLDSEGIYRVPGNRAHVDLLFQKFEEDRNVVIQDLDIPVNAVATALKDFLKRLPPILPSGKMEDLTNLAAINDRSFRLLALRDLLNSLPVVNFQVLKFTFQHLVKVAENCKLNNMDSKNLAICWWPTLLPLEFNDMNVFERMRPHLEDAVQTMIDQYPFLFCGKEEKVMV